MSDREELLRNGLLSAMHRAAARGTRMVRTDGEDSILIEFCSFARGRLTGGTPARARHPIRALRGLPTWCKRFAAAGLRFVVDEEVELRAKFFQKQKQWDEYDAKVKEIADAGAEAGGGRVRTSGRRAPPFPLRVKCEATGGTDFQIELATTRARAALK